MINSIRNRINQLQPFGLGMFVFLNAIVPILGTETATGQTANFRPSAIPASVSLGSNLVPPAKLQTPTTQSIRRSPITSGIQSGSTAEGTEFNFPTVLKESGTAESFNQRPEAYLPIEGNSPISNQPPASSFFPQSQPGQSFNQYSNQTRQDIEGLTQPRTSPGNNLQGIEVMPPALDDVSKPRQAGLEEIRQFYDNGKLQIRRYVRQDREGNYIQEGPWVYFDQNERVIASGTYREGIMHGQWKRIHTASEGGMFAERPFNLFGKYFESVASFDRGKLDGAWTVFDRYRRKIFEITYRDGVRHGMATWWYPNGARMRTAKFADGVLDGEITDWSESEKIVGRQIYVGGRKLVRNTTFYRPSVRKDEDQYLEPKLEPVGEDNWWEAKPTQYASVGSRTQNGPSVSWYENGQLRKKGRFANNQRVGKFTWWHRNGNKQIEGSFEKGLKSGRWTWWHENGMKSYEGIYKENEPTGIWRSWNQTGQLIKSEDLTYPTMMDEEDEPDDRGGDSVIAPKKVEDDPMVIENLPVPNESDKQDDSESNDKNADAPVANPPSANGSEPTE